MPGPGARDAALGRSPVFEGLDDAELDVVAGRMRARQFAPDELLCRAGEPSDRIWLLTGGLVSWTAPVTAGGGGDRAAHAQGRRDRGAGRDHRQGAHGHGRGEHAHVDARARRRGSRGPRAPLSADPDQRHPDAARAALPRECAQRRPLQRQRGQHGRSRRRGGRPGRRSIAHGRHRAARRRCADGLCAARDAARSLALVRRGPDRVRRRWRPRTRRS